MFEDCLEGKDSLQAEAMRGKVAPSMMHCGRMRIPAENNLNMVIWIADGVLGRIACPTVLVKNS